MSGFRKGSGSLGEVSSLRGERFSEGKNGSLNGGIGSLKGKLFSELGKRL